MRAPVSIAKAAATAVKRAFKQLSLATDGPSACVETAARVLLSGGLVAMPTDTVYGLACLADCRESLERVYAVKGRSSAKPLAVCLASASSVSNWTSSLPDGSPDRALLSDLLPGPVTLVLPRGPGLSPCLNPGVPVVGVRVPDHQFALELCRRIARPLALTSANISGGPDTHGPEEFAELWPSLDLLVDGGRLAEGPPSTVVELLPSKRYRLLRAGRSLVQTEERLRARGYSPALTEGAEGRSST